MISFLSDSKFIELSAKNLSAEPEGTISGELCRLASNLEFFAEAGIICGIGVFWGSVSILRTLLGYLYKFNVCTGSDTSLNCLEMLILDVVSWMR